jgi:pSer/pThr/pTyr-binding forkhead associated (FHA) protein
MPALIAKDGPLVGERIELDDELVVGRENQGLTIEDPEVSRRHAVFRVLDGGRVELEDFGSLNGTFVNGRKLAGRATLEHGDLVKIGTSTFELEAALVRAAPTVVTPAPAVAAPTQPFGAFAAADVAGHRRGKVASRQLVPELISILAVVATAIALVLYFALR